MNERIWKEVDDYYQELFITEDEILKNVIAKSRKEKFPQHHVTPHQAEFLALMIKLIGARSVLEIGTLAAYSTIWMARALPQGGKLITLESYPRHADMARSNIDAAGLREIVTLMEAPALDSLARLSQEEHPPFDLIFIDADKGNNPAYLEYSLKLSQPGTLIIADNVVRDGRILDAGLDNIAICGLRRFNEMIAGDARLEATMLQTVGGKGYDGFTLIRVKAI